MFCICQLILGIEPAVGCGLYTQCYSIEQNQFSFSQKVPILNSFLIRLGICVHFAFSELEFLRFERVQALWMLSQSLWVQVCISQAVSGRLFPELSSTSGSYNLLVSSSA